jgi:hypothetical protein
MKRINDLSPDLYKLGRNERHTSLLLTLSLSLTSLPLSIKILRIRQANF